MPRNSIHAGGWALVLGAAAFLAVFSYLAASFDYPAILDGPADTVLPRLLATGAAGRAVWAVYAFLPLLWLPAGVGAYRALRDTHPGGMLLALQCAGLGALSMMLGLMRWPSLQWRLAELHATADATQRPLLAATFDGYNTYLGNYLGEFLGELSVNAFFLLTALAWLAAGRSRWLGWLGVVTALAGFTGMFRNVTGLVAPVADINNYLLPLWMIVLGVALIRGPAVPEAPRA